MKKKKTILFIILVSMILSIVYIYTDQTTIIPYPITGTWYVIDLNDPLNTDLCQVVFDGSVVKTTAEGKEKTTAYSINGHTLDLTDSTVFKDTAYTLSNNSTDYVILSTDNNQSLILVKSNQIINGNNIGEINSFYSVLYSNYPYDIDSVTFSNKYIGLRETTETPHGTEDLLITSLIDYTFSGDYLELSSWGEFWHKSMIYKISDDKIILIADDGNTLVLEDMY